NGGGGAEGLLISPTVIAPKSVPAAARLPSAVTATEASIVGITGMSARSIGDRGSARDHTRILPSTPALTSRLPFALVARASEGPSWSTSRVTGGSDATLSTLPRASTVGEAR